MVVWGVEGGQGTLPLRNHAAGKSAQAGGTVGIASVPTPLWPAAGVCGSIEWAIAGTRMEENMQGAAQSLPTLGAGTRGELGGGQPPEGGAGPGRAPMGGCRYQPAGAVYQ